MRKAAAIRRPRRSPLGFTLLELVIVIGVLGLMAGVGLEALISVNDKTAFRVTVERLDKIREALRMYSRDTVPFRIGNNPGTGESGIVNLDCGKKIDPVPPGIDPSALRLYVPFFDPNGSPPSHSPYLPPSLSRSSPGFTDDYFDGWGSEFLYLGPPSGLDTVDQAIAYVVSMGPDRIQDFTGKGTDPGDDLVYEINCTQIFNAEAQQRVDEINSAISKQTAILGRLIKSSDLAAPNYQSLINYLALVAMVLPNDDRYRYSPWMTSGEADGVNDGYELLGGLPVGQVGYLKP